MTFGPCTRDERWQAPVGLMLATFFGGLIILIPSRIIWYKLYSNQKKKNSMHRRFPVFGKLRASAQSLLSGNTTFSKVIVIFTFLVNLAAVILYLVDATLYYEGSIQCGPVIGEVKPTLWIVFSVYFMLVFIARVRDAYRVSRNDVLMSLSKKNSHNKHRIRFIAAPDKLYMWIDPTSIVDHFTIMPTLAAAVLDRNWFAFRCLRALHLMETAEVLQFLGVLKHRSSIRIVQVASFVLSVWLSASGFVHVTENSGDPFYDYANGQELPYWKAFYWLLVTMSTVGYGDINPATNITKAFIILFIMGSFAMFSSLIPELLQHMKRPKYKKPYRRSYGKRHIVVCGSIDYDNVKNLLLNLEHEDALSEPTDVVFVSSEKPGLELEAFFRRRCSDIFFYHGLVMDLTTLQAVKLIDADVAIVMTNKKSSDPDGEDSSNVMKVAALKNYNPNIRVIVQLLLQDNKTQLLHIPKWRWKPRDGQHDQVVCLSELKMGIMAQNCLAPGITTLLSNLFTNRSFKSSKEGDWTSLYKQGSGNEIYVEAFSSAFYGMTFKQAAELCFTQLEVLLVAIDNKERSAISSRLRVNPGNQVVVREGAVGYFFAQGPEDARKVAAYRDSGNKIQRQMDDEVAPDDPDRLPSYFECTENNQEFGVSQKGTQIEDQDSSSCGEVFDPTGNVYWCSAQTIEDCTIDADDARQHDFSNHIVVLLHISNETNEIGIESLVTPLRASCIKSDEIKDIVLLVDPGALEEEWPSIRCIPKLFIFKPTKHSRRDMKALNVTKCSMCLVFNAGYVGKALENPRTVDRQAILSSLAIQSMFGQTFEDRIKAVGGIRNGGDPSQSLTASGEIPMATVLEHDENIVFVDPDDSDNDLSVPLYLKPPYASGRVFSTSCLDSLLTSTYLNSEVLRLVRALTTGTEVADYEMVLLEGLGLTRRKKSMADVHDARNRSYFTQLSLAYGPLERIEHDNQYGKLFVNALRHLNLLCIGVYRLFEPDSQRSTNTKRCVITNPPYQFKLLSSDRIFVLKSFNRPSVSQQSSVVDKVNDQDTAL